MLREIISKKELKKLLKGIKNREVTKIKFKKKYFKNLFPLDEFNRLLNEKDYFYPNLRMANHNNSISPKSYTELDNRVSFKKVQTKLKEGNTLIVKSIQKQNKNINNFLNRLNSSFHINTNANIYLVSKGQKGLNIHYDTHDILAVQIAKKKYWNIYKSIEDVNLNSSIADNYYLLEKKYHTIKLKKSEALYIPKGVWHSTYTKKNHSLHLAIGLYPMKLKDIIDSINPKLLQTNIYYFDTIFKKDEEKFSLDLKGIL
jgi:ribosomal protein L16 Arg81 hydroxylase